MDETMSLMNADSIIESNGTLDTIAKAAKEGAIDARETANRVWEKTSLFVCRFVYTTSYTLSYGVVFPATLIARSVHHDNAAIRGMMDGAKAASEKIHQMKAGK